MMNKRRITPNDADEIKKRKDWIIGFNSLMIEIWRKELFNDRFEKPVFDTGALHDSISNTTPKINDDASDIYMKFGFLKYGVWQHFGVGREVPRGNPGDIGRPKVREERPWIYRRYNYSLMRLRDFMAESFCQEYMGIFTNALSDEMLRAYATE